MKVLVIDNYDSFVYNLVQLIGSLGAEPVVYRNDRLTIEEAEGIDPYRIVISPGPGSPDDPRDFGVCLNVIRRMSPHIPTLGVCLGHQGIIHAYGGRIVRAGRIRHGETSVIQHDSEGIFKGVENPFMATRYHSLVGERSSIPSCLKVTATSTDDGEIMGVRHVDHPVEGVQFHPESILTLQGRRMMFNFLSE